MGNPHVLLIFQPQAKLGLAVKELDLSAQVIYNLAYLHAGQSPKSSVWEMPAKKSKVERGACFS